MTEAAKSCALARDYGTCSPAKNGTTSELKEPVVVEEAG